MKRLLLLLIVSILSLPSFAQGDEFVFVGTDVHVIRTGFSDRHPLEVSLCAASNDGGRTWSYSLLVNVVEPISRAIPKGGLMLLRSATGEVIELRNEFDELASRDFTGSLVPGTTILTYHNKGSYAVTLDQLKLLAYGVQKVRIAFLGEYIETEYKKDKWGEPMVLMLEEIAQKTVVNNIREGF